MWLAVVARASWSRVLEVGAPVGLHLDLWGGPLAPLSAASSSHQDAHHGGLFRNVA